MTKPSTAKRIAIFGHVGTQNLGDEIIIAAVLQNIRSRYPDAEISAFTFNPDDTRARHGISAFPIRRRTPSAPQPASSAAPGEQRVPNPAPLPAAGTSGLKASLKKIPLVFSALKALQNALGAVRGFLAELAFIARSRKNLQGTDLLMIAGSGQLTDASGGPWAYPYTFFKWFLIARSVGTKIAFVSIGTGWIDSSLSKFFLRRALRGADYRSFREESAVRRVAALGVSGENPVVPDLAYSLQMPAAEAAPTAHPRQVIGINPIPFSHEVLWHEADKSAYGKYVDAHAGFAAWLIARGYAVVFFPTQLRADPPVIADIVSEMERRQPGISAQLLPTPQLHTGDDLLAAMAGMDFVVAARFHGVLVSHLLGKPVLGVSYHQKTADLMARMSQQDCTLKIEGATLETLTSTFSFLESHQAAIRAEFARGVPECRTALDAQYERVFGLIAPRTTSTKTLNTSVVPAKEPSNARINYGS